MKSDSSLATAVQLLVPLKIVELEQAGGPTAADWQWLTSGALARRLATLGEQLVCGIPPRDDPLLSEVVRSVALLAYLPGGIHLFGTHFIPTHDEDHL